MKERITITIDKELLNWLDAKVNDKIFANRSHGFEFLIKRKIDKENERKNYNNLRQRAIKLA
jgi:metal-responsive CopG/Arc/MetJ family transcriptional regulator